MKARCVLLCAAVLLLGVINHGNSAEWRPAPGPLMTPWSEDVTPQQVWPAYPRPQMVRPQWINLNGLWDYAIQAREFGQPGEWEGTILVPYPVESALSGVRRGVGPDQRLWYRRKVILPSRKADHRWLLHFGAVDWKTTVWVNGHQVAEHTGGYDPFIIDITDALVVEENELVCAVWDPTDQGFQPRGKQVLQPGGIMYTAVTGIWQTVWLEEVPFDHIESLKIVPDVDRQLVRITVHAPANLEVLVTASDGEEICATASGTTLSEVELQVENPTLWSPEQPHLYTLRVELRKQGSAVDAVSSYFGMRKIEVRKDAEGINRLMLNNQPLFQFGPLDQGWWPDGLYTPATEEAMKYDILLTKKFGMNLARKHVKYEPALWYYWCDRLGLLVWQDMPSGDSGRNAESQANYRRELRAMIDALHNFPSIVMWVPFNEGWGQHDTAAVVEWIEQYDPTRPVNEASGWTDTGSGMVSDVHAYPGPGMRAIEEKRAVVLGEFGGLGMPVAGHTWQAEKNWGYVSYKIPDELTDAYVNLLAAMRPLVAQGLSAAVYTQTSDVEVEVNGLLTYDREIVKIDVARAAEAAARLYLPPPISKVLVPSAQTAASPWRYCLEQPGETWFQPSFDDSSWPAGAGGFGTKGTPGSVIGTIWNGGDIWLRRTFELESIPAHGQLVLSIHHDEDAEVYLNGTPVGTFRGYTTSYGFVPLPAAAIVALRQGTNTLAIHCHQTGGGQFIDAGLVLLIESDR